VSFFFSFFATPNQTLLLDFLISSAYVLVSRKFTMRYGRKEFKDYWKPSNLRGSDFFSVSFESPWAWWTALGYTLSVSVFFVVDKFNMLVIPSRFFRHHALVDQVLSSPSLQSKLVSILSPCIISPIWEEFLYRGISC